MDSPLESEKDDCAANNNSVTGFLFGREKSKATVGRLNWVDSEDHHLVRVLTQPYRCIASNPADHEPDGIGFEFCMHRASVIATFAKLPVPELTKDEQLAEVELRGVERWERLGKGW